MNSQIDSELRAVDLDQCCLFAGYKSTAGYGFLWPQGGSPLVHRKMYEALFGKIPDGFTIDHLCKVRCCINIDHLEPVTLRLNLQRKYGEPGKCKRGHLLADNVYERIENGTKHRQCRKCHLMLHSIRYNKNKMIKGDTE